MKNKILQAIIVSLVLLFSSCLKDKPLKLDYSGMTPSQINDGWEISTPEAEMMVRDTLEMTFKLIFKETRYPMARSLIVARHGKLVAEAYPNDLDDINRIENIQSCTKSFTSILTGIALQKHELDSLDQRLSDIYPEYFIDYPGKKNITIRNALMMKTGLDFINSKNTLEMYISDNSVNAVLSQDKLYEPGIVFNYNDGAPQLVSAAIQQRTGVSLSSYANEFLFTPLGITDWIWENARDGITFGAFALYLKPRDLVKVGQLLLQHGTWNGQQIVDSTWIEEATAIHGTANGSGASYGYYFWIFPAYGGFAVEGHGGQFIFVIPGKDLVVVYTAFPYTDSSLFDQFTELMDLIIKSCN
jgi:CubicO group peptidase (beta-lactamase class C family)